MKVPRQFSVGIIVTSVALRSLISHMKWIEVGTLTKIYSKWIKDINIRLKMYKTLGNKHRYKSFFFYKTVPLFTYFWPCPLACGNNQARDKTHTTAATQVAAVVTPDP